MATDRLARADELKRWRLNSHLNFAQAAEAMKISLREYAMLECGVTLDDLLAGDYPSMTERKRR